MADQALWKAAVLGVVEGLTEFLPVSSTGHLIAAREWLGFSDAHEVFTYVIQLGAILAVCALFARRLTAIIQGCVRREAASWRFVASVTIATLPALVIGMPIDDWADEHLMRPAVVALALAVGGLAILMIERQRREPRYEDAAILPWHIALAIGGCQLLALIPGVSRSGATILGAICIGVARPAATQFSFFLAMPILFGIAVLKLAKHRSEALAMLPPLAVGFVVSAVVAGFTVHWLLRYVAHHDFRPFGWYRIAAGLALGVACLAGWIAG